MKPLRLTLIGAAIVLAGLFVVTAARAENAVRFVGGHGSPGGQVAVNVIIENGLILGGAAVYFRWSTPDMQLDSIVFQPDRWLGNVTAFPAQTDFDKHTSGFLVVSVSTQGWIPVGSGAIARLWFSIDDNAPDQHARIDSVYEVVDGLAYREVQFSDRPGNLILPAVYPALITIGSPVQPEIEVSPEIISLTARVGDPPVSRTLSIQSRDGDPFDWTAAWSSSWLDVVPDVGASPSSPRVSVDLFSLQPGSYLDTIVIASPNAANSPVLIPVSLVVDTALSRPPEVLNVRPAALVFQAGPTFSDLPRRLILTVATGAAVTWSATWKTENSKEGWLDLSISHGATPDTTLASVDRRSLVRGVYHDTITIRAPAASNSPVPIPVTLYFDTSAPPPPDSSTSLGQNRPNPFVTYRDPETQIQFRLTEADQVRIRIYDVLGRPVRNLFSGQSPSGESTVRWDGRDDDGHLVASGHYFYRMATSTGTITKPMVVIK